MPKLVDSRWKIVVRPLSKLAIGYGLIASVAWGKVVQTLCSALVKTAGFSTHSKQTLTAPGYKPSHYPLSSRWFYIGFSTAYFSHLTPMNYRLSPLSTGSITSTTN